MAKETVVNEECKVYDWMTPEDEWMKPYVDVHLKNAGGFFGSNPQETTHLYSKPLYVYAIIQTEIVIVDQYGMLWEFIRCQPEADGLFIVVGTDLQGHDIVGHYDELGNGLPTVGQIRLNNIESFGWVKKNAIRYQCTVAAIKEALNSSTWASRKSEK